MNKFHFFNISFKFLGKINHHQLGSTSFYSSELQNYDRAYPVLYLIAALIYKHVEVFCFSTFTLRQTGSK